MTMTYEEEAGVAQRVLHSLAYPGSPPDVRGAQVQIAGNTYSVHRHGADLRFNQRTGVHYGGVGNFLIVAVGEHSGGWMLARAKRPPGEYHDARAAEAARALVERALARLGYDVGTGGREGRKKTAAELEADVRAFLNTAQPTSAVVPPAKRRPARRRPARQAR